MAQAGNRPMRPGEWIMLAALSVLWGGSFCFIGVAVGAVPPLTLVFARVALAATALFLILRLMGQRMPADGRVWAAFLGMALLNNVVPFTLLAWSQTHIASGLASILNATTPLWMVLVAHLFTADEKASPGKVAGVALGFAGVVVMIGGRALAGLGTDIVAQLACLAATLSYAFAGVFGRRFKRFGVPPLATATGQVTMSALVLLPIALLVDQPWRLPPPGTEVWAAILGLAVLSTAAAYVLYFRILATAGASNLLLVTFLIPVTAILLGSTLLGEVLEAKHFIGMGLIGAGLAAIDGRPVRALATPLAPKAAWRARKRA